MNIEPAAMSPEQIVACAIFCCDKKAYPLKKHNPDTDKECQRLGTKKHSCVLHQLREKKDGKLTQKNRFADKGIKANPKCSAPGIDRPLIPDTMIGNHIIDAKFPCDPKTVKATPPEIPQPSLSTPGTDMLTPKELDEYPKIEGNPTVEAMTPQDAEAKKGDCKCEGLQ